MKRQINWAGLIPMQIGRVPYFEGHPGAGKTALMKALAKLCDLMFQHYLLDQESPEDIGGLKAIKMIEIDAKTVEVMASIYDERFVRAMNERCLLLFDELSNAPPQNQAAILEIVNKPIPGTWMAACGNPVESAANGAELTPPLANRLVIVPWEMDSHGILMAFKSHRQGEERIPFDEHTTGDIPVVPKDWHLCQPLWSNRIGRFLSKNMELLQTFPSEMNEQGRPWPSPRSWENASICLAGADSVNANKETRFTMINGCVGKTAAEMFVKFSNEEDLPIAEDILAQCLTYKLPRQPDMAMAVLRIVFNFLMQRRGENDGPERFEQGMDLVGTIYKQRPEIGMMFRGHIVSTKPESHVAVVRDSAEFAEMDMLTKKREFAK